MWLKLLIRVPIRIPYRLQATVTPRARPVWCQPRDDRDRRHPRMIHPRRARAAAAPLAYFLRLRFTETPARTGATPSEI